ncbi:MAG: alpha/beta hydrolase [Chloroflexi bacterium]|nr:alpha/beta hydrolase [Chloroflexota bacterium]
MGRYVVQPLASPAVQARGALAMLRYDATATLPTIAAPVLVTAGHLDHMTVPETGRYIRDQVPNGRYVELRPGGHMAILEANERFNEAVAAFVAACSLGSTVPRNATVGSNYPNQ